MRTIASGVLGALLAALCPSACGGQTVPTESNGCDAPTLANCPQDTIPDAAECPLPPVLGAHGFFTVGCKVTTACGGTSGAGGTGQVCACTAAAGGPKWGCTGM